ncbi:hypothetical protein GCM10010329_67450 [Streptomyces spiroverticillatus]|uniref:Uncharacterized protein n=1 Tax=Streptomyces finlayi TaxID=67296 RepID=A0A918X4Z8_9ACTN|nr:hypothetical protein GCM10010329_67450 [Streptomyces spiroverticillatus]GHD12171.1 hypothetical protein GCM10010334_69000 [Streptomyces finlayi]
MVGSVAGRSTARPLTTVCHTTSGSLLSPIRCPSRPDGTALRHHRTPTPLMRLRLAHEGRVGERKDEESSVRVGQACPIDAGCARTERETRPARDKAHRPYGAY